MRRIAAYDLIPNSRFPVPCSYSLFRSSRTPPPFTSTSAMSDLLHEKTRRPRVLYYLLQGFEAPLSVFRYLSFRIALAAVTSFLLALVLVPLVIRHGRRR